MAKPRPKSMTKNVKQSPLVGRYIGVVGVVDEKPKDEIRTAVNQA